MMFKNSKIKNAFSLIELSVVILIISILLSLTLSSNKISNSVKNKVSKDKINIVYNAIGNFISQKKRMPCPASLLLPKSNANYGKEVRDINSLKCMGSGTFTSPISDSINIVYGAVPVVDLGLSPDFAEDGFGNKISYFMDQRFAQEYITNPDSQLAIPSFGTAIYKGNMQIKNRNLNGSVTINNDAIIILLSHGANGFGAFNINGNQNSLSTDLTESDNYLSSYPSAPSFDRIFYISFDNSIIFDDLVIFRTRNNIINDFKLMPLIPCKGKDIVDADFQQNSLYYGQTIQATNSCQLGFEYVFKAKKCDAYGRWVDLILSCPPTSALTCLVGGSLGMKSKTVNRNSSGSDGECEQNYGGYYTWSCSADGVVSTSNNCIAYCNFSASSGMEARIEAPGTFGSGACVSGYVGYFDWECDINGNQKRFNYCSSSP